MGVRQRRSQRDKLLVLPDLLEQLAAIELKPLSERLIASFWPTAVAALLMIAVSLAQWSNRQRLTSKMNELSAVTAELSVTEQELAEWDSKEKLLGAFAESKQHRSTYLGRIGS